jgi:hypothetical protein
VIFFSILFLFGDLEHNLSVFETKSTKYSWLNHAVSVGVGTFKKNGVMYKVYAVK